MKNYKFNPNKGDLSKLDSNELLKTLNETISLLKDINEAFLFLDETDKENVNLKKIHRKAKLIKEKLEKKYSKNLDVKK